MGSADDIHGSVSKQKNILKAKFTKTKGVFSSKKMQNAKCQLLWNDEMQNAKLFRVMFSSIQNAEFIVLVRLFWVFLAS